MNLRDFLYFGRHELECYTSRLRLKLKNKIKHLQKRIYDIQFFICYCGVGLEDGMGAQVPG